MFWGLSEALDLFAEYQLVINSQNENLELSSDTLNPPKNEVKQQTTEINILLFGPSDPRHIIKTMAKMYAHKSNGTTPVLNFYIIEGCIEIVARNIALLGIAFENPESLNLRSKVHLFMDVYGNTLMRASSHHYLGSKTKSLLKAVTDDEWLEKLAPILNIDGLKYRERDGLENAMTFWLPKECHLYNIQEYWNGRLRKLMATRYDYRDGQFDWDLNMVLKERKCKQICSQEYRYWRETGIAFTFPQYEYSKPNKTLAAGLVRNGDKYMHRGYVGDIQTGPFASFGLQTTDQRMLKSVHGENDYRSTDITERNLLELFHEIATQSSYEHDEKHSRKYGSVRLQMGNRLTCNENDLENKQDYNKPWINVQGVKVHMLSSDDIFTLQQDTPGHWSNFFNVVFVGHNYFAFLKDTFVNILRSQSLLIMETKLLTTERQEIINKFEEKLLNYAKRNNLVNVINYNALNSKNSILKFKK